MQKECSICHEAVEDGDDYLLHITGHQTEHLVATMQHMMRTTMLAPSAVQVAVAAAETGKPVKDIISLYREAMRELLDSGTMG